MCQRLRCLHMLQRWCMNMQGKPCAKRHRTVLRPHPACSGCGPADVQVEAGKFRVVSSSCDAPSCFSRHSELGISGGQASLCRTNFRASAAAALYNLSSFASCCSSLNAHDGTNRRTLPPSRWLNCSSKLSSFNLYANLILSTSSGCGASKECCCSCCTWRAAPVVQNVAE